jgi:hypothetical protein
MMIKEVNMRQFKQLGWVSQTVMSLVLLSAMSQSNAMSVYERYLQEHPAAKVESSPEKISVPHKESSHHKKNHFSDHQVVKTSGKHVAQKHEHRHALKNHVKIEPVVNAKHSKHRSIEKSVKKDTVATPQKQQASHPVRKNFPRVVTPKLTPNKFGRQQARDAELALQHQSVKTEVATKLEPRTVVRSKHHHTAKPNQKHHHKRSSR